MATATMAIRATRTTFLLHRRHHQQRLFASTTKPSHHRDHVQNHVYLKPTTLIGSFLKDDTPKNPKEAAAKLARLRREYAVQVKEVRKQYFEEMELERQEKRRKEEARKVEIIRLRDERNKAKAAAAVARAAERKAIDEDFRLTLMKEKAEKLEYWRSRQKKIEEKKKSKRELICQQSSGWIDETQLEAKIMTALVDSYVR